MVPGDAYIVRGCVVVACYSLIQEVSTSLIDCYQQPQSVGAGFHETCLYMKLDRLSKLSNLSNNCSTSSVWCDCTMLVRTGRSLS